MASHSFTMPPLPTEARRNPSSGEKHTQEILGNVDLSGDGKISYDEFR